MTRPINDRPSIGLSINEPASNSLPDMGFIRAKGLVAPGPLPFSEATLWRKVRAGLFPAPCKLSERITAWRVEDVRRWMDEQGGAVS